MWEWISTSSLHDADPELHRRKRLLARLLAVVIPLGILSGSIQLATVPGFFPTFRMIMVGVAVLTIAYVLNRRGRYLPATLITSTAPSLASFGILATQSTDWAAFSFLLVGVVLGAILLGMRGALWVTLVNLAGLLLLPAAGSGWTYAAIVPPLSFNLIIPALILVALRHRNLVEADRQAELRASEQRYRTLVETMSDGLAVMDENMISVFVNDRFCQMLGYEREEMLGRPVLDLISASDREILKRRDELRHRDDRTPYELTIPRKDGVPITVRVSPSTLRDADGRLRGSVAVMADITEERRARAELRRSARTYEFLAGYQALTAGLGVEDVVQTTLEFLRDQLGIQEASVALIDEEGGFRPAAVRTIEGHAVEHHRPVDASETVLTEVVQGTEARYRPDIAAEAGLFPMNDLLLRAGCRSDFLVPLWNGSRCLGTLNCCDNHVDGFTEERRRLIELLAPRLTQALVNAELFEAVRASEARFRALFREAGVGIALNDLDGRLLQTNPALEAMLGYTSDDLAGMVFTEFTHPEDAVRDMELYRELMAGERDSYQLQKRYVRRDGSLVPVNLTVTLLRDGDGAPQFGIAMVDDLTEHMRLEREILEVSGREQRRMGQDLHDSLGQILAGTGMLTAALERELQHAASPGVKRVGEIRERLNEALEQTRALSRGLSPVGLDEGGLHQALGGLARDVQRVSGMRCTFLPDPVAVENPEIATHVYHIAQEALNNAVRHSRASHVSVRLSQERGVVVLEVGDDGVGLRKDRDGDGLGLRIMEHRAHLIDGSLEVTAGDGGTRVVCRFPVGRASLSAVG